VSATVSIDSHPWLGAQLWHMIVGKAICNGTGASRSVYEVAGQPHLVLKVESAAKSFCNNLEWELWKEVKGTAYAKWFAPCHHISDNGALLVMSRTQPLAYDAYPRRMPVFFDDFKRENYGLLDGRVVAHDYGLLFSLLRHGLSRRMKAVDWWNASEGAR
jgi:hypothetical protein